MFLLSRRLQKMCWSIDRCLVIPEMWSNLCLVDPPCSNQFLLKRESRNRTTDCIAEEICLLSRKCHSIITSKRFQGPFCKNFTPQLAQRTIIHFKSTNISVQCRKSCRTTFGQIFITKICIKRYHPSLYRIKRCHLSISLKGFILLCKPGRC